jgi:hypothetical protein
MHLVDFVIFDVARRQADPLAERRCFAIDIDEDETADHVAAHFVEAGTVRDQTGIEGFLVGDFLEFAVARELPGMERAGKARHAAAVVERDPVAAVWAHVIEGLDGGIFLADQ